MRRTRRSSCTEWPARGRCLTRTGPTTHSGWSGETLPAEFLSVWLAVCRLAGWLDGGTHRLSSQIWLPVWLAASQTYPGPLVRQCQPGAQNKPSSNEPLWLIFQEWRMWRGDLQRLGWREMSRIFPNFPGVTSIITYLIILVYVGDKLFVNHFITVNKNTFD